MADNTNLIRISGWSGLALVLILFLVVLFLPGTAVGGWLTILSILLIVPFSSACSSSYATLAMKFYSLPRLN